MRFISLLVTLVVSAASLSAQDIPRSVLILNDGGFLNGTVADSSDGLCIVRLPDGNQVNVHSASIAGEYRLDRRMQKSIRRTLLSPEAAILFSLVLNGAGQLYVGHYSEAAIHLALQAGTAALVVVGVNHDNPEFTAIGLGMMGLLKILSMVDAGGSALAINRLRINRAVLDGIQGSDKPPLELSCEMSPIEGGAAAGVQIRF